jgi:hypothetical protein
VESIWQTGEKESRRMGSTDQMSTCILNQIWSTASKLQPTSVGAKKHDSLVDNKIISFYKEKTAKGS